MAYFEKRGDKWRAMVRKKGHRTLTKTFSTKGAAQTWARETERDIEKTGTSTFNDLADITIKYLIDRFIEEFEPKRTKRGSLKILKKGLGHLHLTDFGPQDIVTHCKRRRDVDGVSAGTQSQGHRLPCRSAQDSPCVLANTLQRGPRGRCPNDPEQTPLNRPTARA
jgi:hypothetical protein